MVAALKNPPVVRDDTQRDASKSRSRFGNRSSSFVEPMPGNQPVDRLRLEPQSKHAERRVFPRKIVGGHIQGKRLDHSVTAHRMPFMHLNLEDLSVGGLKAKASGPVEIGENVVVFFPPEGNLRGWDAYGRVVRCKPRADTGYEVALEFNPLPAA
jgi:hypothetical protein